ncbi:DUF2683 family protein [Candidatus Woesearchaeota archaeon]|nr:DUF2683 family protein [Candidatus Woesearchaeota archaeon]MBT4151211.1 DUF2683 family protein [Candidatus Woesearchaeota archaeon]MBT4247295.1 DUF2683 family protein [Candidatus Woesearchaeota archaeon]MBT4434368.1 DUF2683 family protein [Candidatus Woesearchaeota archaeon]MBT7331731.1 DUF2683 family protein [Candidatus Woesearchaeota archaeon]
MINLGEYEDRILTIVKGKFGFKNKSQAINFVVNKYGEDLLEPELKPEYVQKIKTMQVKEKPIKYKSINDLRKEIENA